MADSSVTTAHSEADEPFVAVTESSKTIRDQDKSGETQKGQGSKDPISARSDDETVAAAAHPQQIGKYEVIKLVGHGGFADVFLARNPQLEEDVAIKVPRANETSESAAKAFLKEARTAATLRHPNIVSIRDAETDADGRPYVIMDWLEGGTLDDARKRKVLSFDEIVSIMRQIAEAAAHAHKEGFVHRDLKPSNILFDKYGRPHIADFGLAIHERDLHERRGEFAGTRRFMSPEQVRRDTAAIDGRCDVWALGVILYLLLTAEFPFDGTHTEVEDAILDETPKPPKEISHKTPEELQDICLACLTRDLDKRLRSADELVARLQTFSRNQDKKRARRRFLAGAAALVALGGAGAYGGYWIYDRNRELRAEEVYRRANASWEYNWDGDIVCEAFTEPNEPALLFLTLGEIGSASRDYEVTITLEQLNRELGIALVLGYRDNQFQSLMLFNNDGNIKVERRLGEFIDPVGGYYKLFPKPSTQVVGTVAEVFRRNQSITVSISGGRITDFRYGSTPCPNIEDANSHPSIRDPKGYIGQVGIMTTHGTATITDFGIKTQ